MKKPYSKSLYKSHLAGKLSFILTGIMLLNFAAKAQLNPLGVQYFSNEYIGNPAMAGLKKGLTLSLSYRDQWGSVPGAPVTQAFTADYSLGKKTGLGLNIYNDKAGLLKRTRVMGSYSYHVPLDEADQKLSFGISLGFMNERVDESGINGDSDDMTAGRFNDRNTYVDGDFGIAYTSSKFTLQGAIPNLKSFFKKDDPGNGADRSLFFTALSYKLQLPGAGLEPKVCYRGVKGHDNLWDIGTNVVFLNNQLNLFGMYHSSESATLGLGLDYRSKLSVNCMYTTETSALREYAKGGFEISLGITL